MTKEEKIRQRKSYIMFEEWFNFLQLKPNTSDILRKLYSILEHKRAFGSRAQSNYAHESLIQFIKDFKLIKKGQNLWIK